MFSRQKPDGFTNDQDTIPAAIADGWDENLSRALDGVDGGKYTLTAILELIGEGLGEVIAKGLLTLTGSAAGILYRRDTTTLVDADGAVDASKDTYQLSTNLTTSRFVTVRHSGVAGSVVPRDGQRIRFVRNTTAANSMAFRREDASPIVAWTANTGRCWHEIEYNAATSRWELVGWGAINSNGQFRMDLASAEQDLLDMT